MIRDLFSWKQQEEAFSEVVSKKDRGLLWGGKGGGGSLYLLAMKEGFRHMGLKRRLFLDEEVVSIGNSERKFSVVLKKNRTGGVCCERSFIGGGVRVGVHSRYIKVWC